MANQQNIAALTKAIHSLQRPPLNTQGKIILFVSIMLMAFGSFGWLSFQLSAIIIGFGVLGIIFLVNSAPMIHSLGDDRFLNSIVGVEGIQRSFSHLTNQQREIVLSFSEDDDLLRVKHFVSALEYYKDRFESENIESIRVLQKNEITSFLIDFLPALGTTCRCY